MHIKVIIIHIGFLCFAEVRALIRLLQSPEEETSRSTGSGVGHETRKMSIFCPRHVSIGGNGVKDSKKLHLLRERNAQTSLENTGAVEWKTRSRQIPDPNLDLVDRISIDTCLVAPTNLERKAILVFPTVRPRGERSPTFLQVPQDVLQESLVGQMAVDGLEVDVDEHRANVGCRH